MLFDVMDTLVHDPFFQEVPAHFGLSLEELLRIGHPTAWIDFELGRIDQAEYVRKIFVDGRSVDAASFVARMREAYSWIEGVEPILAEIKLSGHALYAFSNYPPWYQLIEARLGLGRYLDWSFVSCRTGLRKPDPAAYHHVCRTLNVAPAECFFVDDRASNCHAARALGMGAHHFRDAAGLRAALAAEGLI